MGRVGSNTWTHPGTVLSTSSTRGEPNAVLAGNRTTTAAVDDAFRRTTSAPCRLTARRAWDDGDAADAACDVTAATALVAAGLASAGGSNPAEPVLVGEPPAHADSTATATTGTTNPRAAVPDNRDLTDTVPLNQ